jgi:hypothetical protein
MGDAAIPELLGSFFVLLRGFFEIVKRGVSEHKPVVDLSFLEIFRFGRGSAQPIFRPAAIHFRERKLQDRHFFLATDTFFNIATD